MAFRPRFTTGLALSCIRQADFLFNIFFILRLYYTRMYRRVASEGLFYSMNGSKISVNGRRKRIRERCRSWLASFRLRLWRRKSVAQMLAKPGCESAASITGLGEALQLEPEPVARYGFKRFDVVKIYD